MGMYSDFPSPIIELNAPVEMENEMKNGKVLYVFVYLEPPYYDYIHSW